MKPTAEQIKQALLHPDTIVRDVALQYFALSFSQDQTILPLAIQAIQRYGWEHAFQYNWMVQHLVQNESTLLWFMAQVDPSTGLSDDKAPHVRSAICDADAELLARHESRLADCKGLTGAARRTIAEKIQLLSVPGGTCWNELEGICERHKSDRDSRQFPYGRANRLVEAIARDGQRHAERVLSVLSQKIERNEASALTWLEIYAAKLAGLIRLGSAAPLLASKLKDDDSDFMNEECTYALTRIGDDAAIEAIVRDFHSGPSHFRLYASSALQDMRGDNVVAAAMQLLKGTEDWDTQAKFIGTALANFDPVGLKAASEFGIDDLHEYRREMVATAVLTGEEFADLERLRREEQDHQAEVRRRKELLFGGKRPPAEAGEQKHAVAFQSPRSSRKVGRNDPCPCGSGKKYKKCCLMNG